jgi:hypothetical protein
LTSLIPYFAHFTAAMPGKKVNGEILNVLQENFESKKSEYDNEYFKLQPDELFSTGFSYHKSNRLTK